MSVILQATEMGGFLIAFREVDYVEHVPRALYTAEEDASSITNLVRVLVLAFCCILLDVAVDLTC